MFHIHGTSLPLTLIQNENAINQFHIKMKDFDTNTNHICLI